MVCDGFLQAMDALKEQQLAAVLPDCSNPVTGSKLLRVRRAGVDSRVFYFRLAGNPRLLRLNPHAAHRRDFLGKALLEQMVAGNT